MTHLRTPLGRRGGPVRSLLVALSLVPFAGCGGVTSITGAPDGGAPALCDLPAEPGNCLAYAPAYHHEATTGLCTPFVYGGCGGNANRFPTQEDCRATCKGGTPDRGACEVASDCVLTNPGCCAACDPVDRTAFVALNRKYESEYTSLRGCDGVQCGPCQDVPEEQKTRQYFVATCENGQCVAVDIRTTSVTACKDAADCSLRDGAQCCEGCDSTGIVSVASLAGLRALVCDPEPGACPPCVPRIPPEFLPTCEGGRCSLERLVTASR